MTRRPVDTAEAEIYEATPTLPAGPGSPAEVPVVHLRRWYGVADLWVYRDAGGRVRTLERVRGLPQPLPEGELLGWPPVGTFLAAQGV